ncbi:MAG: hypothetical protein Q8S19_09650 [Bacillota bacterium]|nr:hypothetical protein [Bacillota bacterium]
MSFLSKQRQEGHRAVAVILMIVVVFIIYSQITARSVPLPQAYYDALRQTVPQERLDQGLIDARRSGSVYTVHVAEVHPDGRRMTFTYEIDENMNVREKGMSVGYGGPNPVNTILALLLGCALLSYAIVTFALKLFSQRCPHCRQPLGFEFLTLYSGSIANSGDSLPPIVLRTAKCGYCDYTQNKVSIPGEFRAASVFAASFGRTPSIDEKLLELQQKMREETRITEAEWDAMLQRFKEEYES